MKADAPMIAKRASSAPFASVTPESATPESERRRSRNLHRVFKGVYSGDSMPICNPWC